jgi:hypothetical protein
MRDGELFLLKNIIYNTTTDYQLCSVYITLKEICYEEIKEYGGKTPQSRSYAPREHVG